MFKFFCKINMKKKKPRMVGENMIKNSKGKLFFIAAFTTLWELNI